MKKIIFLLVSCVVLHCSVSTAQSLQFNFTDSIPVVVNSDTLHNAWAGGINTPLISEIDLNGDGIHDLFVYDRSNSRILPFLNDGSPGIFAWHYAPEYITKFPPIIKWAVLYDYNCDGKADFFTLAPSTSGMSVYRNDFDSAFGGLRFTLVAAELNEEIFPGFHAPLFVSQIAVPSFGDVDNDGDMDILGYTTLPDGRVVYHRNYSVENSYGCDSLIFKDETETWGHFAISQLSGGNANVNCFNCRSSSPQLDADELVNYHQSAAAPRDDSNFSIFMIDIDGDNDKDLLIGDSGADNTLLVVNGGTPAAAQMASQQIIFPDSNITTAALFCTFHFHAYIDVDNDGVKDLLVLPGDLEDVHSIWFYKNTGTTNSPNFIYQSSNFLTGQMIDEGQGACPAVFDADGDGLTDLVVGNNKVFHCSGGTYTNSLHLYKNIGTSVSPAFQLVDSDYAGISSMFLTGPLYPAFGDLDGDNDKDMIIGSDNGLLQYFTNTGGSPSNFQLTGINFMGIDVGNTSTPQIIDLNRDGLPDLVVGAKNGHVNYFQNQGSATVPFFSSTPTIAALGGNAIDTNLRYTAPFIFDDSGSYKLLLASSSGRVFLYDSIDGNISGNYRLLDTIINMTQGSRTTFNHGIGGGDLNHDGLTDVLLGNYGGGVGLYMQYNPFMGVPDFPLVKPGFAVIPNPVNDACVIDLKNVTEHGAKQLTVMNYTGQVVLQKNFSSARCVLNTHDLPPGVYMIRVISSGRSATGKLVVNH
ncbi:MAG: FG-GAP-like repeat-containing protein [Bacteroidetes bacterium]|nr:FG-GAP-like repeat-containing protein [Bacteroidota bacterium]